VQFRDLSLDPFQVDAIELLREGRSVLVAAPTGTGKTVVADQVIVDRLQAGEEVVYTAPIKALSNQKYRDYCELLGEGRVGLVTGDLVIRPDAPLRIMTTEILRNMLLLGEPLDDLSLVVIDEIHFLDEPERGTVWEELLIYLPRRVQILGLSATLANLGEFAGWLSWVRGAEVAVVREMQRAVPLRIGLINRHAGPCGEQRFEEAFRRWSSQGDLKPNRHRQRRSRARKPRPRKERPTRPHEVVAKLQPDLMPCLYFVYSRRLCESFARDLARRHLHGLHDEQAADRVREELERFDARYPDVLTAELGSMLLKGVAFHHAGLHIRLKGLVERLYEQRLVQVLYCTSTFALGINMPARTVVFHETHRYDGKGFVPLTVREFQQIAGRAGRRGIDRMGNAVLRMDFGDLASERKLIAQLMGGDPEPVSSAFNLSFNSVVNLLARFEQDQLKDLLHRSFLSYQLRNDRGPAARRGRRKKGRLPKDMVWQSFRRKVNVLKGIGYLDEQGGFQAGAQALRHLQIEEVFATELVLNGVLEAFEPPMLFAVLCTMSASFGPSIRAPWPRGELGRLVRRVKRIHQSEPVRRAAYEQSAAPTFCPEMAPLGLAWYEGVALLDIADAVDASADVAGLLVNAFRRAKDQASQLRDVYRAAEDDLLVERLGAVIRTVGRDEVEVVG